MKLSTKIIISLIVGLVLYLIIMFLRQTLYPGYAFGFIFFSPILLPAIVVIILFTILGFIDYFKPKVTIASNSVKQKDYSKWLYGTLIALVVLFLVMYFSADWFIQHGIFGLGDR